LARPIGDIRVYADPRPGLTMKAPTERPHTQAAGSEQRPDRRVSSTPEECAVINSWD
jgi:hypothetical protein